MRIGQARHNCVSLKIDNARFVVGEFSCLFVPSHENDSAGFHRHRLAMGLSFVNGVDVSVDENEIDTFRGAHATEEKRNQKEN